MMTSVMAAVPAGALAPQAPPAAAASAPVVNNPVADGSLSEEDYALQQAATTGQPFEVVSRRTESSETWAQPEGSFKVTEHGTPVRLWREGEWVAADPTLEFAPDGSVVTKATDIATKFSGGGTAPLIQGAMNGRTLTLTWPNALPKPTLDGNVATYAEVLPGVDLQLKAEIEGFSQVFVVKTPQAAQNAELARLQFGIAADGLTVEKDAETGSLTAKDPAGQIVFSSSAPMMWDSTTTTSQQAAATTLRGAMAMTTEATATAGASDDGSAFDPGLGAQDAVMPTELTSDTLTITPDQELLTGAETTYPVYIDPSWGFGDRQKWNWTRVYKAYPGQSFWNSKDPVRVGYEAQTGGSDRVSRSFFQLDVSHLKNTEVKSATFRVKNTWSWSCQAREVHLYPTGAINSKTNWTNQPGKLTSSPLDTVNDAKGWVPPSGSSSSCPAGNLEFDATSWVRTKASEGAESISFGLYADENDTFGWKKFDPKTVVLETVYNTPPELPEKLGTSPATPCASGATLGNATVGLYATIKDADYGNLSAEFELYENKAGSSTRVFTKTVPALNGRVATLSVPVALTVGGTGITYSWRVRAVDSDKAESAWKNAPCAFKLDRQRPGTPPKIVSPVGADGKPVFPSGDAGWPTPTGPARQKATFTFQPVESDVKKIYWWTDSDPDVKEVSPAGGVYAGLVSIPSYGPHMIYAYSVDAAGNRSDTATYLYYANKDQERDESNDVNGDRFKDIWSPDGNGTLIAYTGHGDRAFSTMNAASGAATFPGQQVSAVGDWQGDGFNDLLALVPNPNQNGAKDLQVYKNNGSGLVNAEEGPLTLRTTSSTPNYWSAADQVIGGDFDADPEAEPDVLVKTADKLWFYRGTRAATIGFGRSGGLALVGGPESQWNKYTIVSTGDINGDDLPDLLLRDDATGDLLRSYATPDPANPGRMNLATWGRNRVKVGSGLTKALYPQLGVSGDLDGDGSGDGIVDGDGIMDLWARKADNTMVGWRGKGTPTNLTGFDAPYVIDGITGGMRLAPKTVIASGHSVTAQSSTLTMGLDGKLSIANKAGAKVWSSAAGTPGSFARVENNGNLSVCDADNSCPWTTGAVNLGEGFAVLKDSGDLVVYNDKSQALWSSGTSVRHDHNRDGRSDMANWYDYYDGHDSVHVFTPASNGKFETSPRAGWSVPAGEFYSEHMKRVTGDFNGDGVGDLASIYGYSDGRVSLFTWLGKGDGTFGSATRSWTADPGHWYFENMTPYSGDFNGDGRDDLAVWYDYSDTTDTLFTFTTTVTGTFNHPVQYWRGLTGWEQSRAKTVSGDFNGDGRDDLATFYHLPDGSEKIRIFSATVNSTFVPADKWSATTWGDWNRTTIHAGDFNGDGRDDVAAWYDYADGTDGIHIWTSTVAGGLANAYPAWTGAKDFMFRGNIKLVTGDYNGDGKDEFAGLYGYDVAPNTGAVRTFTWLANASNKLDAPMDSWYAAPGNWSFDRVTFFEKQL
ncbi:FG-GAP-like repeat-containing protein [Streptomyces flavochromogenes]|uniref:FG-GAP-like repeat-containing protein n=1 Tax=Streptomyces flavochromogenes TaxID=68199 RepID=UPI000A5DF2F5|nr:FG-GAP-like repeat-containing protein [Streptomyces flavochromogenes]